MATMTPTRGLGQQQAGLGNRNRKLIQRILSYALLVFFALVFMLPILWMFTTSIKSSAEWFTKEIRWIPNKPTLDNYRKIFDNPQAPMGRWFINSIGVATAATVITLALDALAAYAYARMHFPGRRILFALLLATLFLPGLMFLVPNFLTIYRLGLLNSYAGVVLPSLASIFGVFFLRQFFETIPHELEEAAEIDGANTWQTFFRVVLPLAKPALATLAIITFLASWNDFLWPLLILQSPERLTLPPGLASLKSAYAQSYGQAMAGAMIAAAPVLILYVALQRFIVQSVAMTGLKG
jgi:multiple sugar transport system permease protein